MLKNEKCIFFIIINNSIQNDNCLIYKQVYFSLMIEYVVGKNGFIKICFGK